MFVASIFSILIRGATLAARAFIIFFLARYLSPGEVGVFGVMVGTAAMISAMLGFEFYVYNSRELLSPKTLSKAQRVKDQFIFHIFSYPIVILISWFLSKSGLLPPHFMFVSILIFIAEHLSHEISRLLFNLSKPIEANIVLFLRHALWVIIFIPLCKYWEEVRDLAYIWSLWLGSATISVLYGFWKLRDLDWRNAWGQSTDWQWIGKGIKVSSIFFLGSSLIVLTEYADRYIIGSSLNLSAVGVFSVFVGIGNVIKSFSYFGCISILLPKIISAFQSDDILLYNRYMRKLLVGCVVGSLLLSIIVAAVAESALQLIGKPDYSQHIGALYIIILSAVLATISYVPHYFLFVRGRDRDLLAASLAGFVTFCASILVLVPLFGLLGASFAKLIGFGTLFIVKAAIAIRVRQQELEARLGMGGA